MKYKVGDKVRVRRDLQISRRYGSYTFAPGMDHYKGSVVTISKANPTFYRIEEDEGNWIWTDEMLEGLVEDELTAEEAIRLKCEMCESISCSECKFSRLNNGEDLYCNKFLEKYPEQVLEILKQWKKDHEKKKEVETEIVYLIKVMKEEGDSETCVYAYKVKEDKDDINEKMDELVKQYYKENGGKIYAKYERICRVKS